MLAVIAKLNVIAGKEEEFEAVMLDLAAKVNANEPGCHLYKLCKMRTATIPSWNCTKTQTPWPPTAPLITSKPRVLALRD